MKKTITYALLPLLGALGLLGAAQAAPVPVVVTGYTADVVADGTGPALSRVSLDFDGASYALMTVGYTNPNGATATTGLPTSGLIASANTPGLTFQLAAYTANNSLRIGVPGTGSLTLTTPRAAADVFVLASSGSGISTVAMTVTFTDNTTQTFAAAMVPDWYGGTPYAIAGLGRVSTADNTITNGLSATGDPRLYEYRLTLAAANQSKLIQSIGFNKSSTAGVLNVMGVSINPLCSGAPTAGTAATTAANTCAGTVVLSLTGASTDGGIAYQWQASTNGGTTYANIAGATGATYTVTGQTVTTQYRAVLTCSTSMLSATSAAVTVTSAPPTYATVPLTESFENTWLSVCGTRDAPTASWRNTPATGNPSWRRDDDGVAAAWVGPTNYAYTPTGSQGTHSARFHSGQANAGQVGMLDFYVNLSGAGAKRLSFDFINTSSSFAFQDSLYVLLSTNGGTTFGRLLGVGLSGTGFLTQTLPISATSATCVVRFRAKADFGTTDIGLDNIVLEPATGCLTPVTLAATTTPTTAALTWVGAGSGTHTVVYGPTGFNPATGGTSVAGLASPTTTLTGLMPGTTYQFYVTQNCTGGTNSAQAGPVSFTTQIVNDDPCGATVLTINNTCTAISATSTGATTTASSFYAGGNAGTGCGANANARDVWFKFTTAATGPTATAVRITVTGNPASAVRLYAGATCTGPLTYISCAGTAANTAAPNLDATGLTASTTYYVRVSDYNANGTLGNFTICAAAVPNCPDPAAPVAGTVTCTTAALSWGGAPATGSTYTVTYGLSGFNPATGGTAVTGISGTSTTLTGLTGPATYQFYVQQVCGGFNGGSAVVGPIAFTTPVCVPGNDDPCGAVALTAANVGSTNVGATTSVFPGIMLPACTTAQTPRDVWFSFTAGATSSVFTILGTAAGMVRVFTAPSCSAGPFVQVFCRASSGANAGFGGPITVSPLVVGQRYFVAVSGYGSGDTPGSFTLSATQLLGSRNAAEAALAAKLQLYPNPSNTGSLTLRLGEVAAGQALLVNALGQVVRSQTLPADSPEHSLNTRGLAAGVYTLRVRVEAGVLTRKVVLE